MRIGKCILPRRIEISHKFTAMLMNKSFLVNVIKRVKKFYVMYSSSMYFVIGLAFLSPCLLDCKLIKSVGTFQLKCNVTLNDF